MSGKFELVKSYLLDLDLHITGGNDDEELVIVEDEDNGIKHMVIDCEAPIVVLEQLILRVPEAPGDLFRRLLQMNRTLVHGAFVLDEDGRNVIYRDTLQLENLDANELEASIESLSLALAEYGDELLGFVHAA